MEVGAHSVSVLRLNTFSRVAGDTKLNAIGKDLQFMFEVPLVHLPAKHRALVESILGSKTDDEVGNHTFRYT
jgi:hypothetical protein